MEANSILEDKKDKMIQKILSRVIELKNQGLELKEQVNQKVMKAARKLSEGKLSEGKIELKGLRQEKEEVEQFIKEKEIFQANITRMLSELENALSRKRSQVQRLNAIVGRLQGENDTPRQELEATKSSDAKLESSLKEVSERKTEHSVKTESQEKLKARYSEKLAAEKKKFTNLKERLEKAEEERNQFEAMLNEEVKANDELLLQANVLKKEREQVAASVKSREDIIKSEGEKKLHKHIKEIQKLKLECIVSKVLFIVSLMNLLKRLLRGDCRRDKRDRFRRKVICEELIKGNLGY